MKTLENGARFGKYRIENVIGQGGMGIVYLAEDTTLGRRVALKVLSPDLVASNAFEDRFRQEARIVAKLNHPNIVQIHSLESIEEKLIIDMTYVEGGSLADAERGGYTTFTQTLHSVGDALAGLASCHKVGIIHRDVKPSNILLNLNGNALLSDFGLSKCLAAHQQTSMSTMASSCLFVGTPRYAPPESWEGKDPTPAWDVYSTGAVVYEAATGRAPHEGNSPLELIRSFYEDAITPLAELDKNISRELSDTVADMLHPNPEERLHDASDALARLSKTPEYAERGSSPGSTIVRVHWPKQTRRRLVSRTRLAVAAGILVAAMLMYVAAALLPAGTWFSALRGTATPRPILRATNLLFNGSETLTNERWNNYWLMERDETKQTWYALASEGTDILLLEAPSGDEALEFQGHWAHYTDETARAFRYGTAKGQGVWVREEELMSVSLQFECELDGSRWQKVYLLDRSPAQEETPQFVADVESRGLVSRLVYCELLPRNLEWANQFEDRFVSRGIAKEIIPRIDSGDRMMNSDGKIWQRTIADGTPDTGVLKAHPIGTESFLELCCDEDQLYLLCMSPLLLNTANLTIQLLTRFDMRPEQTTWWRIVVSKGGDANLYKVVGEGEHLQRIEMPIACIARPDGQGLELTLPFAALELHNAPLDGTRWRLSGTLAHAEDDANQTVSYWGRSAGASPLHGEILLFGPNP